MALLELDDETFLLFLCLSFCRRLVEAECFIRLAGGVLEEEEELSLSLEDEKFL